MIVRPDEISARSAPSTSPLKHCDMKASQLTTLLPAASTPIVSLSRQGVSYHEERAPNGVSMKRPDIEARTYLCADWRVRRGGKGPSPRGGPREALALVRYRRRGRSRMRPAFA